MDYCIEQLKDKLFIHAEDKNGARKAVFSLKGNETDVCPPHYRHQYRDRFKWVDEDWADSPQATLEELLAHWRWEARNDKDGNIVGLDFQGQKYGDDDLLFKAIAPYVRDGGYIRMEGEDGCTWEWRFSNGECQKLTLKSDRYEDEDREYHY